MENLKQLISTECTKNEYHYTFLGDWNVLKEKIEAKQLKPILLYEGYQIDFVIINPETFKAIWLN